MGVQTGYTTGGADIGIPLVEKAYLIDRYPELAGTFKQAGLWLWGFNQYGQLGDYTRDLRYSPVQTISAGTNWKLVASGDYNVMAIKTDGTLWGWGNNANGQLGDNTQTWRSSPVQTISGGTNWKQVSCGSSHTAAIKTDGTLWLWGLGNTGQLGNNSSVSAPPSPIQTVSAGTNWKQVSCGYAHTAAVKTDGTLWLWGYNNYGELGDNTTTRKSSPVQTVAGGTNWKQVACANYRWSGYTAAIKTDGTLWTWGGNSVGQLGDNTTTSRSSPVQTVAGGTNWKQVACGLTHTAAIKTDGTLWLWGGNGGQLGDNTITSRSSPVQTVAGGTNWKQVACGQVHSAAMKTDGTLWTWGGNNWGNLGDNTTTSKSSPVQTISGGTNWKQVVVGNRHMAAIRDDSSDPI